MNAATPARRGFTLPGYGSGEEPEWTVLLTVAIALVLGVLVQTAVTSASRQADVAGMSLSYPAKWSSVREAGTLFSARDIFGGNSAAKVSLYAVDTAAGADTATAAGAWTVALAERYLGFHATTTHRESLDGRTVTQIEYVYVVAQTGSAPVLMRGIDTIATAGDTSYALSFVAPTDRFDDLATRRFPRFSSTFHDILASWRLK